MAKKKQEFDLEGVLMAAGGGSAANVIMNISENNIQFIKDNPMLAPIIPSAAGALGVFFMPAKYKPLFYGMIGAAGGELTESTGVFNGISRINLTGKSEDNVELNGGEDEEEIDETYLLGDSEYMDDDDE